jgi:hypothetical protein
MLLADCQQILNDRIRPFANAVNPLLEVANLATGVEQADALKFQPDAFYARGERLIGPSDKRTGYEINQVVALQAIRNV